MTLGQIIARLENAPLEMVLRRGWGEPDSYRGYYDELAFAPAENVTVASMLAHARAALGKTFVGYKGGEYEMREWTECWIAEWGSTAGAQKIGPMLLDLMLSEANAATEGRDDA